METLDVGHEVDYAGFEWFKDPPPPTQMVRMILNPDGPSDLTHLRCYCVAQTSPAAAEPFVPQPGVIEQNEMFGFALKSAPSVLYSKYKQFGQVGLICTLVMMLI